MIKNRQGVVGGRWGRRGRAVGNSGMPGKIRRLVGKKMPLGAAKGLWQWGMAYSSQ